MGWFEKALALAISILSGWLLALNIKKTRLEVKKLERELKKR